MIIVIMIKAGRILLYNSTALFFTKYFRANHTKSTQLNPPITDLITITIATTIYPKKIWRISKMEEVLTLEIISFQNVCGCRCIFVFSEIVMFMVDW